MPQKAASGQDLHCLPHDIVEISVCFVWVEFWPSQYYQGHLKLGPVVPSIVSLTSSLRATLLTVLADPIHNILIFFAEKM